MAGNGDIPQLATTEVAAAWVAANVAPFYPATDISLVAMGNEIVDTGEQALIDRALFAQMLEFHRKKLWVLMPRVRWARGSKVCSPPVRRVFFALWMFMRSTNSVFHLPSGRHCTPPRWLFHEHRRSAVFFACEAELSAFYTALLTQKAKKYHDGVLRLVQVGSHARQV